MTKRRHLWESYIHDIISQNGLVITCVITYPKACGKRRLVHAIIRLCDFGFGRRRHLQSGLDDGRRGWSRRYGRHAGDGRTNDGGHRDHRGHCCRSVHRGRPPARCRSAGVPPPLRYGFFGHGPTRDDHELTWLPAGCRSVGDDENGITLSVESRSSATVWK